MESAIYYATNGYKVSKKKVMGRQVAGNSFLKAYIKYSQLNKFWVYAQTNDEAKEFADFVRSMKRKEDIKVINFQNTGSLSKPGSLFYPGPDISFQSKIRSFYQDNLWSICGITHTTCSAKVMDSIQSLVSSPVKPWDALICTSQAVHSNVLKIIEFEEENLRNQLNSTKFVRPHLPVIPLGIDSNDFKFTSEEKDIAKQQFDIQRDEIVVLYVGRLSFHAKSNPFPMYKSLEEVAKKSNKKIVLVECGWYHNQNIQDAYIQASNYLCKSLRIVRVDGSNKELTLKAFAVADIFCSLSDNIQETFGITPIEAMAAGLPVLATDWNGYKDTVRDGIEGFLIPTFMPPSGFGNDLAARYALGIDNYDIYIGNISNFVSLDFSALSKALYKLINNDKLRINMGNNALKRASDNYDWGKIIPKYHELWNYLNSIRVESNDLKYIWSARLDPFSAFDSYPTDVISANSKIRLAEKSLDLTYLKLNEIKHLKIVNYSNYTMPSQDFLVKILNQLSQEFKPVYTLVNESSQNKKIYLFRSLSWLNKFNIIEILTK